MPKQKKNKSVSQKELAQLIGAIGERARDYPEEAFEELSLLMDLIEKKNGFDDNNFERE
jgi:hypothetical protein